MRTFRIFSAASGTIGAALEAALCGVRAVAVSFAYYRDHPFTDADVSIASKTAVKVIQELWAHWPEGVELFSINVPLYGGILESPKVYTTHFNRARCRSLFAPSPTTPSTFAFKPDYPGMFKSVRKKNTFFKKSKFSFFSLFQPCTGSRIWIGCLGNQPQACQRYANGRNLGNDA